jgi:Family of unknown function (DUF5677)
MDKWLQNPLLQCQVMQVALQDEIGLLQKLIARKGRSHVRLGSAIPNAELLHDYIYFCLSKATRSLLAIDLLLTESFTEDSKILARSAYECYLNGAFALANPGRIREIALAKIAVHAGYLHHPKSGKGHIMSHKIIHPVTNKIIPYGVSFYELSISTGIKEDANVHAGLYQFLSEFVHVSMVASGSYRRKKDTKYDATSNVTSIFPTIFLCLYVSWLTLDLAAKLSKQVNLEETVQNDAALLLNVLAQIQFVDELKNLKDAIAIRLKSHLLSMD